ncbi:MAG TPA: heme biosynthesis HemY N-terminal domain-containing protein, partial [Stellaceae bacterium]|nr:heme biosynthesis HemY N-terminal domain-containing protein [Stellaceae bacterium]
SWASRSRDFRPLRPDNEVLAEKHMVRVLFFVVVLIALALGLAWLIDRPGEVTLNWQGYRIETSFLVGLGILLALLAALVMIWNILRFTFRFPPAMSVANRTRRREKGYAALSRGIVAVGTGDARLAGKAAAEVQRLLPDEPLALLLRAEAAQLTGDHRAVEAAFKEMTRSERTRLLGLRGLHAHAHRRGDLELAHHFASAAHDIAALPWSAAAVLERHVAAKDWQSALAVLENNGNLIDRTTRDRQHAVLTTAIALGKEQTAPDDALHLARSAIKRAPDLVPAVALTARLLMRKGGARKAAKTIETTWRLAPHPELAKLYLDLRPGDSNADRLARARILAKLSPRDPESRIALASAAITACDYKSAREALLPMIEGDARPTVRVCLLMAEIEEAEHGETGYAREWLARASRAPRDACWIAGGVMSEQWLPASPVTGKLDAFVWRRPDERPSAGGEPEEAIFRPIAAPAEATLLIEKTQAIAIAPPEPEAQAGPEPALASQSATGEGAREEKASPGAVAPPVTTNDPAPDQKSNPEALRPLF